MITYLNKRKDREHAAISGESPAAPMVTDEELFSQLGDKIKVVKKWQ